VQYLNQLRLQREPSAVVIFTSLEIGLSQNMASTFLLSLILYRTNVILIVPRKGNFKPLTLILLT